MGNKKEIIGVGKIRTATWIVGLALIPLLLALSATVASAQVEPEVVMLGSGRLVDAASGMTGIIEVRIDTATGTWSMRETIPGGYTYGGLFITGIYGSGDVTSCTVSEDNITVVVTGQSFVLPSRLPMGSSGTAWFVGELTGLHNRGQISLYVDSGSGPFLAFTIPGTIVIR